MTQDLITSICPRISGRLLLNLRNPRFCPPRAACWLRWCVGVTGRGANRCWHYNRQYRYPVGRIGIGLAIWAGGCALTCSVEDLGLCCTSVCLPWAEALMLNFVPTLNETFV